MKVPNFLVVGAAKSGTTSLSNYLRQHPQIFMASPKEPRFITSQFLKFPLNGPGDKFVEKEFVKDFDSYQRLFESADHFKAVGEASADTLYYGQRSVEIIKKYIGQPKIIIILRDPTARAHSAWKMMTHRVRETLSFEEALEAESDRIASNWEIVWHYRACGLYSGQVEVFSKAFPEVKIVLSDDLRKAPQQTCSDLFEFLGVDPEFSPQTAEKWNVSKAPVFPSVYRLFLANPALYEWIKRIKKPSRFDIRRKVLDFTRTLFERDAVPMATETEKALRSFYESDLTKLEMSIGRDLSKWKHGRSQTGIGE